MSRSSSPPALRSWIRLARPTDTLLATAGTMVGAGLAGLGQDDVALIAGMTLATTALSAGSMALNDWHDVAEDRINQPSRPVASGAVKRPAALWGGLALLALGVLTSAALAPVWAALATVVAGASIAYTLALKRAPFAGNLVVAALSTYPLWCWAPVADAARPSYWVMVAGCFVFAIARELVNTARDVHGDRAVGLSTAATWLGVPFVGALAAVLMAVSGVLVWLPVIGRQTSALYLPPLLAATTMLVYLIAATLPRRTARDAPAGDASNRVARAVMLTMTMAYAFAAF